MSRPIKYQAWDGQFMYEVTWLDLKDGKVVLLEGYAVGGSAKCSLHQNEIKAIRQYTGLKDASGKDVYEGDIVRGTTNTFGEMKELIASVEYDEHQILQPFHRIWDYDADLWIDCLVGGFEVIGNIWETSELVKKQEGEQP